MKKREQKKEKGLEDVIVLVKKAQKIAIELGYKNLFQPGLVKELIIGAALGHSVHKTKHEADAYDPVDPNKKYEYLSCWEGGTFQLDRMFKAPPEKKERSLARITRNSCFYCVVFSRKSPLDIVAIYEVSTKNILKEAKRQLEVSSNDISHVGFTMSWVLSKGKEIYKNES